MFRALALPLSFLSTSRRLLENNKMQVVIPTKRFCSLVYLSLLQKCFIRVLFLSLQFPLDVFVTCSEMYGVLAISPTHTYVQVRETTPGGRGGGRRLRRGEDWHVSQVFGV